MRRLLIANRGEIVSRIARTARARGLRVAGVYSEPDAELPYLADLDEAVALAGTSSAETYLDVTALIGAATTTGCDAVHPGYGFLAENATFARAVVEAGLTWVGPSADTVEAMGSKVRAKQIARRVGVPVLPDAVLETRSSPEEAAAKAELVGFPLLVKASAGGGGRGIRLVEDPHGFATAVAAATREAVAAFGDPTLFLERCLPAPRHVEVQVFGDTTGTVLHLGDRECSVQRRHQKLLEEAPAIFVPGALREAMADAAVRIAAEIGYVGAGTCEFLVDGGDYFFLEMNTRLQVEHTVTEEVTGLDLVALQFDVAEGRALPLTQADVVLRGHAIQARVCAEDPAAGWLPSSGPVRYYAHPAGPGLRFEEGIVSGVMVSPYYDSMIAKVIASGPDRTVAAGRLADALRRTRLQGLATNISALARVLADDDYRRGAVSVVWLEGRPDLARSPEALPPAAAAAAVTRAVAASRPAVTAAPPAWSNTTRPLVVWELRDDAGAEHRLCYHPPAGLTGRFPHFALDGVEHAVRVLPACGGAPGSVRVELDGRATTWIVDADPPLGLDAGGPVWVQGPDGLTAFTVLPRFPDAALAGVAGGPASPMPGTVLSVKVQPGQAVVAGQPLVVVEAMKMEHTITAAVDAVVARPLVAVGQAVQAGQVLVEFEAAR